VGTGNGTAALTLCILWGIDMTRQQLETLAKTQAYLRYAIDAMQDGHTADLIRYLQESHLQISILLMRESA
jgi:hypothetical protein